MYSETVILLLGTNLGDKKNNLKNSIQLIMKNIGIVRAKTEVLETRAVEYESSNNYLNQAILVETTLSPVRLLSTIKLIEKLMGRSEDTTEKQIYEDRLIDIDIVQFGNIVFWNRRLEIPHKKHSFQRKFSKELLKKINLFV